MPQQKFKSIYRAVWGNSMKSKSSDVFCIDSIGGRAKPFVGHVQVSSDIAVTTLKSLAQAAYHLHVMLLNVSVTGQLWPIENSLTFLQL